MFSHKLSILVIAFSVVFLISSPAFSLDGMDEDWWGSPDYAEDYINSLGVNSYPDNLLKIGLQYYKNGDFDLAIKNLRESIKFYMSMETQMHPRLSAAYLLLGKIYHKLARYNDAIYALKKAYYSYGYLNNLEAYNLLLVVKSDKKKSDIDKLFARAKVIQKHDEEVLTEEQPDYSKYEFDKFEFDFPPDFFDMAHFEFDSSELTKTGKDVLDFVAVKLKEHTDVKILIDGYCDSKGSEEYNLKLGYRRANSARTYLVDTHNLSPDRLLTRSFGEKAPIDTNVTDSGRAKNRRIQFSVQYP